jgi:hypothetical protein
MTLDSDEEVSPTTVSTATPPLVLTGGNLALAYDAPFSVQPTIYASQNPTARLRFWMVRHVGAMAVDNANIVGMDFTALPIGVAIVEWKAGVGEVEYDDRPRLRENFTDVTPYCPFLQQFMTRLTGITLTQAQKIQCDLIGVIYEAKRQAPYHYPVAAGDYSWDASDTTVYSSTIPAIQDLITKINQLIVQLNPAIPALNTADANNTTAGNTLSNAINSNVVNGGNTLSGAINSNVVNPVNAIKDQVNSYVAAPAANMYSEFNGYVAPSDASKVATLNASLATAVVLIGGINYNLAAPGLSAGVSSIPSFTGACSASGITAVAAALGTYFSNVGNYFSHTDVSWTPVASAAGSNQSWLPVGATSPVNVTPAEQAAIMQGIASRTTTLTTVKNTKTNAVNALMTISAVIAYDVTAGWPVV